MNELKEILESSVLSDEVKKKLQEAFENQVKAQVTEKEVEMAESLDQQKRDLSQAAIEMVEEAVTEEFKTIQDEITEARSLDVRYAIKLEEFKEQYAQAKDKEVQEQVQAIIDEEMGELKESLTEARNNIAGQKMFEAFQSTYGNLVSVDDNSEEIQAQLEESQKELGELRHERKLNELLEGLTGRKRAVMASLMEGVSIDKMDSRFEELSKNVMLKESEGEGEGSDKGENLTESDKGEQKPEGTAVFENVQEDDEEAEKRRKAWLRRSRRLAGLE